jgi:hypothetical protein
MRVKRLMPPVDVEPPRSGENAGDCTACNTGDDAYIWVSERWRVRAMDRPTGLPAVLVLECRSHFDLGDLPNLLAAELGVMTVRLERGIRSLDGVARVHVNRWGDGSAHLHLWFLARPYGRLQLRGTFLSLWDDILPAVPERQWQENLGLVAAWLAEFGGRAVAEPAHIAWQSPATIGGQGSDPAAPSSARPQDLAEFEAAASTAGPDDIAARPTTPTDGPPVEDGVTRDLNPVLPGRSAPGSDGGAVTHDLSETTRRLPVPRNGIPGESATVRLRPSDAVSPPGPVRPRPAGDDLADQDPRPPAS